MERRSEPRVPVHEQVRLTVLGEPEPPAAATLTNLSGRGVRLLVDRPLRLDAAVRIDLRLNSEEALLLGEVIYCVAEGTRYAVGVELQHSLLHLNSLQQLMKNLLGEEPARVQVPAQPEAQKR